MNAVPKGEDWLYELKYDGYRILAYLEGNASGLSQETAAITRDVSKTSPLPPRFGRRRAMVLDGEMTVTDESGKTDFQALQKLYEKPRAELTYMILTFLRGRGRPPGESPC